LLSDDAGTQAYGQLLRAAAHQLTLEGVPDAMRDARRLLAKALGTTTDRLTLLMQDHPTGESAARFLEFVERRAQRQPVSQIIGSREFFGRSFLVTPDVLDPRPDTERLIEIALAAPFERVLDLGTGSGCILLTLLAERKESSGVGLEISRDAIRVATKNAQSMDLQDRCEFQVADWLEGHVGQYDLIVSNPPYVTAKEYETLSPEVRDWEPKRALTPGGDGLGAYRLITNAAADHLRANGRLIVEIGPSQAADVMQMFRDAGLSDVQVECDLDGRDRVVIGHAV
jgi:release factor glutamine methyltransferase